MTSRPTGPICGTCAASADPGARFCANCGAALTRADGKEAVRRQVVVLFADIVGFTSMGEGLDPEALRAVMDRYFGLVSRIIWDHGGATEKFIGDAVMAVFGMPQVGEDDAIRAVQAGIGIIAILETLNAELRRDFGQGVSVRIGIHSGPVSAAYDRAGDFRVVGDTVNTASRLQSAAESDSILVSEPVAQALRGRARMSEVAPLTLKGKEAPFRAWRVESLSPGDEPLPRPVPLIGREAELAQLRQAYVRSAGAGRGALITVLGAPGIGKSRLLEEFLAGLRVPRVLRARALSFNRGISYLPILDLLKSASGEWDTFAEKAEVDQVAGRAVACLTGLVRSSSSPRRGVEVEEIAWALRTFLTTVARSSPLVLVWEDLHWAEPALLDIIEFLADELSALPMLQVCTARPELVEVRPEWTGGGARGPVVDLAPLSYEETVLLVSSLASEGELVTHAVDEALEQVAEASEGNPLFAELLLAMEGSTSDSLPHTITAVFAARLDRLQPQDRLVLEMATVVGRDFAHADLEHLLAEEPQSPIDLEASLRRLRHTRLLVGNRLSGRHCFSQAFCRDTTYDLSAKRSRLRWHLALANRPAAAPGPLLAVAEEPDGGEESTLTYHLEAAALLSRQLHPTSPSTLEVCRRASDQLAQQAADATNRKDLRAAAVLLERALSVLPVHAPQRLGLTLWLSDTHLEVGELDAADAVLSALPQAGHARDSEGTAKPSWVAPIQRKIIKLRGGHLTFDEVLSAEKHFESKIRADDSLAWCRFHQLRSHRHIMEEQVGAAEESLSAAREYAKVLGDARELDRIDRTAVELTLWGPTPVHEGLARCRQLSATFEGSRVCLVPVLATTAGLLGLDGRVEEAVAALETASGYAADLRMHSVDAALAYMRGLIESAGGAHESAAEAFRRAAELLAAVGQPEGAALMDAYACRERTATGDPVPEHHATQDASALAAITDPRLGALSSVLGARAAADSEEWIKAVACVENALRCADRMDDLYFRGTIYRDVAELRLRGGDREDARAAAKTAYACFKAKGARAALPSAARILALASDRRLVEEDL